MIKKKTQKKKAQDKEPDELTEEDIEELLNPGIIRFRNKKEDKNDKDTK